MKSDRRIDIYIAEREKKEDFLYRLRARYGDHLSLDTLKSEVTVQWLVREIMAATSVNDLKAALITIVDNL